MSNKSIAHFPKHTNINRIIQNIIKYNKKYKQNNSKYNKYNKNNWFGNVERRDDTSWLRRIRRLEVDGRNGRGRSCKTWEQIIKEDPREKGLRSEVAQNSVEWRSAIAQTVQHILAWINNGLSIDDDDESSVVNRVDTKFPSVIIIVKILNKNSIETFKKVLSVFLNYANLEQVNSGMNELF